MTNCPPDFCLYCGTVVEPVDPPTVQRCPSFEDYVFHNPCPAGGTVVAGDELLLVEDFRSAGGWKLPESRVECGESPREGVARELREETKLRVDSGDLTFLYDDAGEPVEGQYVAETYFAADRADVSGEVEAGDDAVDARFFSPTEFERSEHELREKFRNPF
jgi:8-oxo-dGTP diphosphatase